MHSFYFLSKRALLSTLFVLLIGMAGMTKIFSQTPIILQESFDGDALPSGWMIIEHESNWSVSASNNAGGNANEMKLTWKPQFNGITRLVTPAVDLTGVTDVIFSFNHALDNYGGTHTIGIATSSDDGITWNTAWSQDYNQSSSWQVAEVINTSDIGNANVKFCIFYSGNTFNINDWFFDDIMIFNRQNLDIGIVSSSLPDISGADTTSFDLKVYNFGSTTVTSIEASYQVEGFEPVTETFVVNIPTLSADTIRFNTKTFLAPGNQKVTYSIHRVNGSIDDVASNDTLEKTVSVALSAAERIPMIEIFTSSTGGPCVPVNNQMTEFCNNNPGRFTYTDYPMNWPGTGDPYYITDGNIRRTYYEVNAVPNCIFDGEMLGAQSVSQAIFDQHAEKPAFFDIRGSFTVEGNLISVKADIMPFVDGEARVFISVNEKETHNNVGSNGETSFHHILMKMLPNTEGTSVNFTATENQHLELSQDMSGTNVEEMNDLEVSIWIQKYLSKEILNSRFAYEYTDHPYPVENLALVKNSGTIQATWAAPTNGNPQGYTVYVNGSLAIGGTTQTAYSFPSEPGKVYTVGVVAIYGNGKSSVKKMAMANVEAISFEITATVNPTEGGTVTGTGTYGIGDNCTLTAVANEGYTFTNWTQDNDVVSTNPTYSFTVTQDSSFTAHFALPISCSPVQDIDGNTYPSVIIGNKCWMAANMRATHYADGREITNIYEYVSDKYPNAEANVNIYGRLYDWYDAVDTSTLTTSSPHVQGICPDGWYLPNEEDFELLNAVDLTTLRSTNYWFFNPGTNTTGFDLRPAGMYNFATSRYEDLRGNAYLWSVTGTSDVEAHCFMADCHCYMFVDLILHKQNAASVRCVKE